MLLLLVGGAFDKRPFRAFPGPPRRPRRPHRLWTALAVVALAAAIVSYWWMAGEEARTIRALPPAQRAPLFQRTMDNLRNVCDPAPGRSLRDFCRTEAQRALQFPECDGACREIARRHLSLPRR